MSQVGYVYILTNPSFREDWIKIGKSGRSVDVRSNELDNTAVPLPFEIFATLKTVKYHQVERLVHKTIDRLTDLRIRQNREFFNIEPHVALDILRDIALTIDDAEITVYRNNMPVVEEEAAVVAPVQTVPTKTRRKRFKFSMIGASIGEEVVFEPTGTVVKIASDDQIEFEGRLYKLSPFTGTFLPEEQRCKSGAYWGPAYFSYKGRNLVELRAEREKLTVDEAMKELEEGEESPEEK